MPRSLRTVLRLVATLALTFLGLLMVTFVIGRVVPIDPVIAAIGDRAPPDVYERVEGTRPASAALAQFLIYVGEVAERRLRQIGADREAGAERIGRVFPATFELATIAIVIGVALGVPIGVIAAVYKGRLRRPRIRILGLFGYSVPVFWLGLVGLLVFYAKLGWVAGPGRLDVFYEDLVSPDRRDPDRCCGRRRMGGVRQRLSHLILPASILGYFSLAYIARMTRSFMIEQLRQEYVIAARIKGLSGARVSGATHSATPRCRWSR